MKNNTIIFGDSYSTFAGFVPDGFAVYYSETQHPETGVTQVRQTWWHQVVAEAGLNLIHNNSWSGSTISYTGYNNTDCSGSSSFIYRLKQLKEDGFFEKNPIDKVFVFGGTNDNWTDAPFGEEQYDAWTENDLYSVLPAVCYFLYLLRQTLPQAEIYCLINPELKQALTDCMRNACKKYHITPVELDKFELQSVHPTVQGMIAIKNSVMRVLNA